MKVLVKAYSNEEMMNTAKYVLINVNEQLVNTFKRIEEFVYQLHHREGGGFHFIAMFVDNCTWLAEPSDDYDCNDDNIEPLSSYLGNFAFNKGKRDVHRVDTGAIVRVLDDFEPKSEYIMDVENEQLLMYAGAFKFTSQLGDGYCLQETCEFPYGAFAQTD